MTTEAGPEPGAQVDAGQVWRAVGRLEGEVGALRDEMREVRAEVREIHRRLDRLLYLGIATSLALLGALIGTQVFG